MNGAEINKRLAAHECLACLKPLQAAWDTDSETGFIGPLCRQCRAIKPKPKPTAKEHLEAGIENLRKLGA